MGNVRFGVTHVNHRHGFGYCIVPYNLLAINMSARVGCGSLQDIINVCLSIIAEGNV